MPREEDVQILSGVYQQLDILQKDITEVKLEIRSVASKQSDYTLPWLDKVVKRMFGNGTPGLIDEHGRCQERVLALEKQSDEIKKLRLWVRNSVLTTVVSALLIVATALITWGRLNRTVEVNTGRIDKLEDLHPRNGGIPK